MTTLTGDSALARPGWLAAVLLAVGLLFAAGPAWAQEGALDEPPGWAYALAHDLMSPFCPGRTLAACPSPQADELRQWILFQAVTGRTQADLEESLYEQFGDIILSAPKAEGWGFSAYAIPALAFLFGGGFAIWMIRRLALGAGSGPAQGTSGPLVAATAAGPPVDDAEIERLVDEEIARL